MKPASQPPHVESGRQSPAQPTQRAAEQYKAVAAGVPVDDVDDDWVAVVEGDAPKDSVAVGDGGGRQRAAMANAFTTPPHGSPKFSF